jgi:hypothetical protein
MMALPQSTAKKLAFFERAFPRTRASITDFAAGAWSRTKRPVARRPTCRREEACPQCRAPLAA